MKATERTAAPEELRTQAYRHLLPRMPEMDRAELRACIEEIGLQEPLVTDSDLEVLDGQERLSICIELGHTEIPIRVLEGLTDYEKRRLVVSVNTIRRHLTAQQRRQVVERLLLDDPAESDRVIGTASGCSHTSVAIWRGEMEAAGQIPAVTHHRGADGKLRPVKRDLRQKPALGDDGSAIGEGPKPTPTWTPPEPDRVLTLATMTLTRHTSGRPDSGTEAIPDAVREIDLSRSVWDARAEAEGPSMPQSLSLDEIDHLPAGQLEALWLSPQVVQLTKSGTPIAHVPVRRVPRSDDSLIKPAGNTKTRDWMGILSSCSHGCGRRGTGLPGCKLSCYTDADGRFGCYCDDFACNMREGFRGSSVIANGLTNDLLRITLPSDGDPRLDDRVPVKRVGDVMAWRVDCESSTGDLSISLGLLQRWAESNTDHRFSTICSHHFRPSDAMLSWLAVLNNAVVGHSVSGWLSPEELESRFAAIGRFIDWGIPTTIWVVTDPDWDNGPVLDRALELVGPEHIIEEPHRLGMGRQRAPILHVNPAGPCSSHRVDGKGHELVLVPGEDGRPGEYLVPLPEGGFGKPKGQVHSRCRGCEVRCGLTAHGMMAAEDAADGQDPVVSQPEVHTPFPRASTLDWEVACGDARDLVRSLDREVHCVLTSPPYFNLKAYGDDPLEVGRETDPAVYVESLCDILGAVPLHPRGSLWVNLRDKRDDGALHCIPERFVVAMRDRGWRLLDRVVWAKAALQPDGVVLGSVMVEPAPGRLNGNGWEHILRFSRSDHPWSDDCAINVPRQHGDGDAYLPSGRMSLPTVLDGRIPPDVWLFGADHSGAAHVAPWPAVVCQIPIALTCPLWVNPDGTLPHRLVGTTEYDDGRGPRRIGKIAHPQLLVPGGQQRHDTGRRYVARKPEALGWSEIADGARPGIVLDPFMGTGTTGVVALRLGRSFLGFDLYEQNCRMAREGLDAEHRQLERDEWAAEPMLAATA